MERKLASLVWATPDIDGILAYIARVSNPENQDNSATAAKLIGYLIRERHWSPFEMANVCVEVNTTRDISRQMLRHDIRPQEFSQRYAGVERLGGPVFREARMKHPTNRQASMPVEDDELRAAWAWRQRDVWAKAQEHYSWARQHGIALECARVVLPEGNTPTRCYFNGYLRDWLFYCNSRLAFGSQAEHVEVAQAVKEVLRQVAPATLEAWDAFYV
jgi:thymidylate synthase (FAD)